MRSPTNHSGRILAALILAGCTPFAMAGNLKAGLPVRAEIRLPRPEVLVGEPVALDLYLVNTGTAGITVPSRLDMTSVRVSITSEQAGFRSIRIAPADTAAKWIIPDLQLEPGAALARRVLLDEDPEKRRFVFPEPGVFRLTVTLDPGYESNEVSLTVRAPLGRDADAVTALGAMRERLRAAPMDTTERRFAWLDERDREDREFIRQYGNSAYANYRRLELAANLMDGYTNRREPKFAEAADLLETVVESGPAFVLHDQALGALIENDRKLGRTDRANLLRFQLLADHPESPTIFSLTRTPLRLLGPHAGTARGISKATADDSPNNSPKSRRLRD